MTRGVYKRSARNKANVALANKARATHGMWQTKEFKAWDSMQQRCYNPKNKDYHRYGGRGIKVSVRWQTSFLEFFADMGFAPSPKHSVERINCNQHYEKRNCKWATVKEQQNNQRSNKRVCFEGRTQTVAQWAEQLGFSRAMLGWRLRNWSIRRALTEAKEIHRCIA